MCTWIFGCKIHLREVLEAGMEVGTRRMVMSQMMALKTCFCLMT